MQKILFLLCTIAAILITGCCSNASKETQISGGNSPASIQENRSLVEAEIVSVNNGGVDDYSVTAKILSIKEDGAYPSIAVEGETYELYPNYVKNDEGKIDFSSERNKVLKKISDLKKGDKFNAEIFLSGNKWLIRSLTN